MSIEAGARAGHHRARRDHVRLPEGRPRAPRGAAWSERRGALAQPRRPIRAPRYDRRSTIDARAAGTSGHLGNQSRHGRPPSPSGCPTCEPRIGGRPRSGRACAGLHGPQGRRHRSRDCRSTASSSGRAPTRGIEDLREAAGVVRGAGGGRRPGDGGARLAAGQGGRRSGKGSTGSSATAGFEWRNAAAPCAWA